MRVWIAVLAVLLGSAAGAQQADPRQQPGAPITVYAPEQHDLYDGRFVISAGGIHMVGSVNDAPGWDHYGQRRRDSAPGRRRGRSDGQ